jgi:ATP-binding cassette, subfamily C (CFTR/MRP), member 1
VVVTLFWKNGSLLTAQAFTAVALINLLTAPVIQLIQLMPQLLQCVASFQRIQDYCNDADEPSKVNVPSYCAGSSISLYPLTRAVPAQNRNDQKHVIVLENNSFTWERTKASFLKNINLKVPRRSVTVIAGAVGSGKSMLLQSILGETICSSSPPPSRVSSIAYCAQQIWLENGTIKSNIIGISKYDSKWYKTVSSACGLDTDLQTFERGDKTLVGSKGSNLSGGQKQRIVSNYLKRILGQID